MWIVNIRFQRILKWTLEKILNGRSMLHWDMLTFLCASELYDFLHWYLSLFLQKLNDITLIDKGRITVSTFINNDSVASMKIY